jgi:hypothetical protein
MAALKFALFIEARRWLHQVGGGQMNIHVCRSPLFEPLLMPHQAACFQSRQTLICTDTQSMLVCLDFYISTQCAQKNAHSTQIERGIFSVRADATQTILWHFDDSVGRSEFSASPLALLFYFLP